MASAVAAVAVFLFVQWDSWLATVARYALLPWGAVAAVCWALVIVREAVAILQAISVMTGVARSTLGLTVLAAGCGISGLVSVSAFACKGFHNFAVAAIFSVPLINVLVGLGCGVIAVCATDFPDSVSFAPDDELFIGAVSLLGVSAAALAAVTLRRMLLGRPLGTLLLIAYVVFLLFVALMQAGVLPSLS
eukprot:TRINITY_DN1124_c0_g2_i2.p1 TRINITY_DN1124_c0_g2~~TRINITY_DN1124_c0_g2_i2.p1  ORF type:complete len:191 (-),score=35.69 TRINITY_DN1124_c0_g2_i2:55-627(-)